MMDFVKLAKLALEQMNSLKKEEARVSFMVGLLTQVWINGKEQNKPRIDIVDGEVESTIAINSGSKKFH